MYSMPPVASKCLLNGPLGNGKGVPGGSGDQGHNSAQHGTQGLIQLCVIVQKDEAGYGLTVSGDKPVHVQSVRENGASARAGVRTGDRIFKVNGSYVANYDHTEVVSLIKAGSHVALTLLRKPERVLRSPSSPGTISVNSNKSASAAGSDRITHPIPADAQQEQLVVKENLETVRRMLDQAVTAERKLQQEYSKNKSQKLEIRLQDAKKTTGAIRKQLELLTGQSSDTKNATNRNSVCLGDVQYSSMDQPTSSAASSMPASVDSTDSSIVRSPIHSTIGEITGSPTTSPGSDIEEESAFSRRSSSGIEHRTSSLGLGRLPSNPFAAEILSMEDDEFSPESQTIVKDHGPFMDFELLRNRHAHCSVFLSFLLSNDDPAPTLFTLVSELYMTGSIKDMRRWAYEIHSTFILKNAPLAIKLDDAIIDGIESALNVNSEREDLWKNIFNKARLSAAEEITVELADFRQKRELGFGNFFGDGDLRDDLEKVAELRIIEKTLRPHYDKFAADESVRSHAMCISLATVMKEWGVHKGGIDRQVSFAMKDSKGESRSSIKSVLGGMKFSKKQKEIKNHQFNPRVYQTTTFCDHCTSLIWGIGFQGYICSNCDMNIHKECINQVDVCKKREKDKDKKRKRTSIIPKQIKGTNSTSSAAMMSDEQVKDIPSATTDEDLPVPSFTALPAPTQPNNNVEQNKPGVGRSGSFHRKNSDSVKPKERRAKSDVDKDGGEKIIKAIDQSRSSSSTSSLSNKSDSSSTERVNDVSKPAPIDEEGDSDLEVEESMPPLDSVIRKELTRKMKPKEKKLQEVINELLYTERSHVRNLKLLDILFHRPMSKADFCSKELVDLVFPDIKSLIAIHVQINDDMKTKMKEDPLVSVKDVANILLSRFDDEAGEKMKEVCALFCRNHSYALKVLKERRNSDGKIQDLLTTAETNPSCRRLQFKDLMIGEVHRLTKYPLLIDSMCNYTTSQTEEHRLLSRAARCSRDILNHVNFAVKDCENHHKLVALQKRLDTRPIQNSANPLVGDYKNLNLQDYKLVYEGALTWRLGMKHTIDLHVVLFEGMLVLLQVQDDGKLVLKCQSHSTFYSSQVNQNKDDGKFGHSPVITLNSMLVRQVATDKKAIFIINTSQLGPQIYNLVANSVEEKKRWFKYISEAADSQKKPNTIRRAPVNKSNLTLAEASNDEAAQDPVPDSSQSSSLASNNNVKPEGFESWNPLDQPYKHITGEITDQSAESQSGEDNKLENLESEDPAEVSTGETLLDDDGERDPKSLVLASITDTMLLKQFLCSSAATASTAAAAPLNAASPVATLSSPAPASVRAASESTSLSDQSISVLNALSRRLNSLLEVVEERENERAQLQSQLQTAEQLLRDTPKDFSDSRPHSFVSNSSSSASVGETPDPQINAMTSIPVIPPVINTTTEPVHSAPSNPRLNHSAASGGSSSPAESDSDDEGTVYADTKEEFSSEGQDEPKPCSPSSELLNTSTDTGLSPTAADLVNQSGSREAVNPNPTSEIPRLNIESASSSADSDSEIERTNIDDLVTSPTTPSSLDITGDDANNAGDTDLDISASEFATAASLVEQAMKAAMDIIRNSRELEGSNESLCDNARQSDSLPTAAALDCDNIDIDLVSDHELDRSEGGGDEAVIGDQNDDIDDSDEADALSASSLD